MARLEGRQGSLDLLAPQAGYVTGLQALAGQAAQPGEVLCYLAEKPALAAASPATAWQMSWRIPRSIRPPC